MMDLTFTAAKNIGISITVSVGGLGASGNFALSDRTTAVTTLLGPPTYTAPANSSSRWDFDWPAVVAKGWDVGGTLLEAQAILTAPRGSSLSVYVAVGQPNGAGNRSVGAVDASTNPVTNKVVPVLIGSGTVPGVVLFPFAVEFV
jgi:hypothetical protein